MLDIVKDKKEYILMAIEDYVSNPNLKQMCLNAINDDRYIDCRGAKDKHHGYKGGLVTHTSEVLNISLSIVFCSETYIRRECECALPKINIDNLITAIVYHDYGKIYEYNTEKIIVNGKEHFDVKYTDHKLMIGHLSKSYALFMIAAERYQLTDTQKDQIGHIILVHHGFKDWGSPVEPLTLEGHIIHYADMLSYKFGLTKDLNENQS